MQASKAVLVIYMCIMAMAIECEGLRCYACSYTSPDDHLCLDDPISVNGGIVTCTKKYCTIFRQEVQTPSGKVQSFLRDCQEQPVYLNQIVEDFTFKTFYRSCTTDLCNSGDGIGSDSSFNPDNPGENMIIPGLKPNSAKNLRSSGCLFLSLGLSILYTVFRVYLQ